MSIKDSINVFVDTMIDSKEKFESVKASFDEKHIILEEQIQNFKQEITSILKQELVIDDEDLQAMFNQATEELKKLLNQVTVNMDSTQKGMKFISDYEQSFNIAVFGKVKAGKSYLGNFIMGNVIRDMGIQTSYDKLERPKVEVYDRGKRTTQDRLAEISEEGNDGFRVDPNEATSAIQLFKLGGLTWFDTPGIGSVTWENEMLAKDYVENADLVIYMSNSDAAGTRQDFEEMKELYNKGKAFLLLLTQSDTTEEDCDEDGEIISVLEPKSEKDRSDTENYICNTLQELGIYNLAKGQEILTVSTKLALVGLETQNEKMFYASNIGNFLEILTNITKTEGATLKLKTPIERINTTIMKLVNTLQEADQQLLAYKTALQEKKKQISEKSDLLSEQMKQDCINRIGRIIRQKSSDIQNKKETIQGEELAKLLSNEIYQVMLKTCAGEFAGVSNILSQYTNSLQISNVGELKMRTDKIEYTVKEARRVERDPNGLFENIASFFGKKYYTTHTADVTKYSTIELGVNEQQIIALVKDQINMLFEEEVPTMMKKISSHFIAPIIEVQETASSSIHKTIAVLENLKC